MPKMFDVIDWNFHPCLEQPLLIDNPLKLVLDNLDFLNVKFRIHCFLKIVNNSVVFGA